MRFLLTRVRRAFDGISKVLASRRPPFLFPDVRNDSNSVVRMRDDGKDVIDASLPPVVRPLPNSPPPPPAILFYMF